MDLDVQTTSDAAAFRWQSVAVLSLAATAVLIPAFFWGFPKGPDLEFHVPVWINVRQLWTEHIFWPRWAGLAQYGYGQPIFSFYPPLSYIVGAALSSLVGWTAAPVVFVWLVLVLAGGSMLKLASRFLPPGRALIAAVLYEANPYHAFRIYQSSAFAELIACAIIPLLILYAIELARGRTAGVSRFAIVLAAICLSNLAAAIVVSYTIVPLICVLAILEKSPGVSKSPSVAN